MNQSAWNPLTTSWDNSSDVITSMTTENSSVENGRNRVVTGRRRHRQLYVWERIGRLMDVSSG